MRNRFGMIAITAASVALFAGCRDDSVAGLGAGGGELSAAEVQALNEAMVDKAFEGWDFGEATASRVPEGIALNAVGAPISIDHAVTVSAACEQGGTASVDGAVTGTIDDQTFAGQLSLDVTTSMVACAFPAEGTLFTVDTEPDLSLSGSVAWDQTGIVGTAEFTYVGGIAWTTDDGRSGTCSIDVLVSLSQDGSSAASGTACGVDVSEESA